MFKSISKCSPSACTHQASIVKELHLVIYKKNLKIQLTEPDQFFEIFIFKNPYPTIIEKIKYPPHIGLHLDLA
jgi:hypothetical protein